MDLDQERRALPVRLRSNRLIRRFAKCTIVCTDPLYSKGSPRPTSPVQYVQNVVGAAAILQCVGYVRRLKQIDSINNHLQAHGLGVAACARQLQQPDRWWERSMAHSCWSRVPFISQPEGIYRNVLSQCVRINTICRYSAINNIIIIINSFI